MVGQRIPLVSSHSPNPSDLILDVHFSCASILKAIVLWSQSNGFRQQYLLSKRLVDKPSSTGHGIGSRRGARLDAGMLVQRRIGQFVGRLLGRESDPGGNLVAAVDGITMK
jgi:hypothetical protein